MSETLREVERVAERWAGVLEECKKDNPRWLLDPSTMTLESALNELRRALLAATAPTPDEVGRVEGLSEAERQSLDKADAGHDYPTETDDGLVQRCACGVWPPTHRDGEQVDPGMWLWLHRRAERHAAVERILAARGATRADGAGA